MSKPSQHEIIMMFLLAFLAFGIVFTLIFMVELVWAK